MNIYKVSQSKNNGWDTYDSFVCTAIDDNEARLIHPSGNQCFDGIMWYDSDDEWAIEDWVSPEDVIVELIGKSNSNEKKIIIASFNEG